MGWLLIIPALIFLPPMISAYIEVVLEVRAEKKNDELSNLYAAGYVCGFHGDCS